MYTQIQCFSQMARSVGNRLTKENVREVVPVLIKQATIVL
jgi:hypothetical protein